MCLIHNKNTWVCALMFIVTSATIVSELLKNILKTSKSPSLESIDNQAYTPEFNVY